MAGYCLLCETGIIQYVLVGYAKRTANIATRITQRGLGLSLCWQTSRTSRPQTPKQEQSEPEPSTALPRTLDTDPASGQELEEEGR